MKGSLMANKTGLVLLIAGLALTIIGLGEPGLAKEEHVLMRESPIQFSVVWDLPGSPQVSEWKEAVIPEKNGGEKILISEKHSFYVRHGDIIKAEYKTPDKGLIGFMNPEPVMAPIISVEFSKSRANEFAKFTQESVGRRVAIIIDGAVVSAPKMMQSIEHGKLIITGPWTDEEARAIVKKLK